MGVVIALMGVAVVLMMQKSMEQNTEATASSSSQFNTLFQPKPVSKKLHCRTIGTTKPDPDCTPGTLVRGITKEYICTPGYGQSLQALSDTEKRAVYSAYDIALFALDQYQIDRFISLNLGGSNDPANLWPQAGEPKPGYQEKDAVEEELHRRVCDGEMKLNDAQRIIATDWVEFYKTMTQ